MLDDVVDILVGDGLVAEQDLSAWKTSLRLSAQIQNYFEEIRDGGLPIERFAKMRWESLE
jgi:hypothetical protein